MEETNVTKEMVRLMAQEFGCLEVSEAELDAVVPAVKSGAAAGGAFDRIDLSAVVSSRVISLYPRGRQDD